MDRKQLGASAYNRAGSYDQNIPFILVSGIRLRLRNPRSSRLTSNRSSDRACWSWRAAVRTKLLCAFPFLDKAQQWRRRGEILRALRLERVGDTIQGVLTPVAAARDLAATLALTHPAWIGAPSDREPFYFPVWRGVSVALQRSLRAWIVAEYFRDLARYEDRDAARPMVVYSAARLCHGRPRTEFTYDLSDYPECQATLAAAWKMIGNSLQTKMAYVESVLREAGMAALSRRYAPVWYQDVLGAVQEKPRRFVALLAAESALINALIGLGTERSAAAVNRFAKIANRSLRNVYGMDLRWLGVSVLHETTQVLQAQQMPSGGENVIDGRIFEDRDPGPPGRPDRRIGGEEDSGDRGTDGRRQMSDAGIVPNVKTRRRKPAGQRV